MPGELRKSQHLVDRDLRHSERPAGEQGSDGTSQRRRSRRLQGEPPLDNISKASNLAKDSQQAKNDFGMNAGLIKALEQNKNITDKDIEEVKSGMDHLTRKRAWEDLEEEDDKDRLSKRKKIDEREISPGQLENLKDEVSQQLAIHMESNKDVNMEHWDAIQRAGDLLETARTLAGDIDIRESMQDAYDNLKKVCQGLGVDLANLAENLPGHPDRDMSVNKDHDGESQEDTWDQGLQKSQTGTSIQKLITNIDQSYQELQIAFKEESSSINPQTLDDAKIFVKINEGEFETLKFLYNSYEEEYNKYMTQYRLELDKLDKSALDKKDLVNQREQITQIYKDQMMELIGNLEKTVEAKLLDHCDAIDGHVDRILNPNFDGEDSSQGDSKAHKIEVNKPEGFFSSDETIRDFAVERAVASGYIGYWSKEGVEQPSTKEFELTHGLALKLVSMDLEDLTSQNLKNLKEANNILKEHVEQNPDQFLPTLKEALVRARDLNSWVRIFQERFNLDEDWVQAGMKRLGIEVDNFREGRERFPIKGLNNSNRILNESVPMDDLIASDYEGKAREIVTTYEGFMRAQASLDYINRQLRGGIPVDGLPERIWDRELQRVSGADMDCLTRSLLIGAHPEWTNDRIEEEVGKAKAYTMQEYKNRLEIYSQRIEDLKSSKVEDHKAAEMAADQVGIYEDPEHRHAHRGDMLNPTGDTGRILFSCLRGETRVKASDTEEEMPLLDPNRPIRVYQFRHGKIQCITIDPLNPEISHDASSSYAVLRHDREMHYYAILPKGYKSQERVIEEPKKDHSLMKGKKVIDSLQVEYDPFLDNEEQYKQARKPMGDRYY